MRRLTRRIATSCAAVLLVAGLGSACRAQDRALTGEDLRVMIDTLLPRISEASGLAVREPVAFDLQPPARVRAYIEARLGAEMGPEEFRAMERAYRAFGLLPDTLDLRALLLELYTEQVIGYYDPRTRRLFVVEGVSREGAEPVVAHELVHALQDQHTNLDSLVARERGNDRQAAAQAAAEGQATLVMIALEAARTLGRPMDPAMLPDLGEFLRPAIEEENARFPVLRDAPRIVRETLIFPYLGGAAFVQALFRAGGPGEPPPVPFGDLLPQSTRQVMNPVERFIQRRDAPTEIRLADPPAGWRIAYSNTLGKLEVSILLAEHLGEPAAARARGWRGDRFALMDGPGGQEVLVWYSAWDDEAAADRFADSYRRILDARPQRRARVERETVAGRPVVRVIEAAAGAALEDVPVPPIASIEEVPIL